MKWKTFPVALIALVVVSCVFSSASRAADRPNIIFFLSDDHRADVMGCAGHAVAKTPTLDRLAKQGTRFENMFVTTSICAASRATLLTGLVERTHGYTFGKPPVSENHWTHSYPALLKKAGYRTGFTGKFGVAVTKSLQRESFDVFQPVGRNPFFRKTDKGLQHEADISADNAIAFIKENPKGTPFCMSVSFNSTHAEDGDKIDHYPWPPSADGLFLRKKMPLPKLHDPKVFESHPAFMRNSMNRARYHWRWDTDHKYQVNMRAYFRMLYGMDAAIGRVLDALEKQGLARNTVIIFSGDNGYYMGERGFAGKWSHFEESLRVPLIIYDPRVPKEHQGRVEKLMAANLDVSPTILAYAGIDIPKHYQGRALKPLVEGNQPVEWRTDVFGEHLMERHDIPKWEGVRGQRYVYARYLDHPKDGEFLHDLEKDPKQLKNFVADPAYSDALKTMRKRCDELRDSYGGVYKPVPRKRRSK